LWRSKRRWHHLRAPGAPGASITICGGRIGGGITSVTTCAAGAAVAARRNAAGTAGTAGRGPASIIGKNPVRAIARRGDVAFNYADDVAARPASACASGIAIGGCIPTGTPGTAGAAAAT
jgi:hypothetical protein